MGEFGKIAVYEQDSRRKDAIDFAVKLASALQRYGIPSHRLEDNMAVLNEHLGISGQFFSSPGTIMASFEREKRTFILRASSGDLHLEKLDDLVALTSRVADGEMTPLEGVEEIKRITNRPDRYHPVLVTLCFMISSSGTARLFGGGWREVVVSSGIGLGIGLLVLMAGRHHSIGRVLAPVAAMGAALLAHLATVLLGPYSVYISTVTGLIVLIPGLSLTVAMIELATGHPVSGTSRLANAMVTFLMLGFGIAMGGRIIGLLPLEIVTGVPIPLPEWSQWLALSVVPAAFTVLFQARPGDIGWISLSGFLAFISARYSTSVLGPELGGFLAAMILGSFSNLFARGTGRPGAITQVPGIMLLVPGSIGFRSMSALLERQTLAGVETAFNMALAAIALVAGLLFANVIFARKRPI